MSISVPLNAGSFTFVIYVAITNQRVGSNSGFYGRSFEAGTFSVMLTTVHTERTFLREITLLVLQS